MEREIEFNPSHGHTIGVEVELQLLKRHGLMFANVAPALLNSLPSDMSQRIKEEFIQCMVEVNTGVCHDIDEVEADLRESITLAEVEASRLGSRLCSMSLHPLEIGTGENITQGERYARIMEDLQIVGRRFITQGLHVHVGVENAEDAIRINNAIRMYLPLLLALTTSSPFYRGEKTGLYSYRTKLFEALPLAGMPVHIDGWQGFMQMVDLLKAGGVIETVRDLWWDVRPNTVLGTVEVRVCDVPTRFADILAIAALVQALVCVMEKGNQCAEPRLNIQILRANKWQAARFGLGGAFINPVTGSRSTIRQAIAEMLDMVAPEARRLGSAARLEGIGEILRRGTGAHRQLELYQDTGDFMTMMDQIIGEFYL